MTIQDREFLHGAAFIKIIKYGIYTQITHLENIHQSLYLIKTKNTESVVLFKVSKKPTSAWSFTFSSYEESALLKLRNISQNKLFIGLICHKDGICCITEQQLKQILDVNNRIGEQRISVSRKMNCGYHVVGKNKTKLKEIIPKSNFPQIIFI